LIEVKKIKTKLKLKKPLKIYQNHVKSLLKYYPIDLILRLCQFYSTKNNLRTILLDFFRFSRKIYMKN